LLLISSLQQTSALLAISATVGSMREDTDCKTVQLSAQCMHHEVWTGCVASRT